MEELTLVLTTGEKIPHEQIRDYFALILEAEQSGEPFPVDLDYVWAFAYASRSGARRALLTSEELFEDEDYHLSNVAQVVKRVQGGGSQPEKIYLSVGCLEFFIARKVRPIFEIYRQCRRMVFERARHSKLPYHIRRYVANHPQIPIGYFSILQQMTMQLIAPLEVQGYTLPDHMLPDISEGRFFCKWLREVKGLDPNSFPHYEHRYEDGRIVPARLYPLNLLADYIQHFQDEWLQNHAEVYFKKRDDRVLPLLPKLLNPTGAQNQLG